MKRITGIISAIVLCAVIFAAVCLSGCSADDESNRIIEIGHGQVVSATEAIEEDMYPVEWYSVEWYAKLGRAYTDYMYRDGDFPFEGYGLFPEYAMLSSDPDGNTVMAVNLYDASAGYHRFLLFRSGDCGLNWESLGCYYGDSPVDQIVVNGNNVYVVFALHARCCGYIWHSPDLCSTFREYSGHALAGDPDGEKISFFNLRILDATEDGITLCMYKDEDLFESITSLYGKDLSDECFLIENVSIDFKTAEVIHCNNDLF